MHGVHKNSYYIIIAVFTLQSQCKLAQLQPAVYYSRVITYSQLLM